MRTSADAASDRPVSRLGMAAPETAGRRRLTGTVCFWIVGSAVGWLTLSLWVRLSSSPAGASATTLQVITGFVGLLLWGAIMTWPNSLVLYPHIRRAYRWSLFSAIGQLLGYLAGFAGYTAALVLLSPFQVVAHPLSRGFNVGSQIPLWMYSVGGVAATFSVGYVVGALQYVLFWKSGLSSGKMLREWMLFSGLGYMLMYPGLWLVEHLARLAFGYLVDPALVRDAGLVFGGLLYGLVTAIPLSRLLARLPCPREVTPPVAHGIQVP